MTAADRRVGIAWLALSLAIGIHVADEALNGFLSVYNPTVAALRARAGWVPLPQFGFTEWLAGLVAGVALLLALTPFAFRGARWIRPLAYLLAVMMAANALGHMIATASGRTVPTVRFTGAMPGFYSSPLLMAASIYLFIQSRRADPVTTRVQPAASRPPATPAR